MAMTSSQISFVSGAEMSIVSSVSLFITVHRAVPIHCLQEAC